MDDCVCTPNSKMVKLCLTVVCLVICQFFPPLYACDTQFGMVFDVNHKEMQHRMLHGKRLSRTIPSLLSRGVFTILECLDMCLRFDRCASFDLDTSRHQKVCKIHGAVKSRKPFVKDESWIHFDLSSEYLKQVS